MRPIYKLFCLIYPEKCPYCGDIIKSEAIACDKCMAKIDALQKPLFRGAGGYRCISSFLYAGSVRRMILGVKYLGKIQYLAQVAEIMAKDIRATYGGYEFDIITYVPMYKPDRKLRRFNQAKLLAQQIAKRLDIPCVETLIKIKQTKKQQRLNYVQRKTNLIGAFKVMDKESIKGKRILIIDDIVTTGITLGTCCKTLSRAKPQLLCCATIANAQHNLPDAAII